MAKWIYYIPEMLFALGFVFMIVGIGALSVKLAMVVVGVAIMAAAVMVAKVRG